MNERIRELVGRAEAYAYEHEEHWHDGPDWQELFNKKFAELIVRECATAIINDNLAKDCSTFFSWTHMQRVCAIQRILLKNILELKNDDIFCDSVLFFNVATLHFVSVCI
jgi:hypothetical protein